MRNPSSGFFFADPDANQPRLFSNFVQLCDTNVSIDNCVAHVVNNTLAFATVGPGSGLVASGTLELHNNILWNPFVPDLVTAGTALVNASNNKIEDVSPQPTPAFLGGDIHPGCDAVDLHLASTSTMIDAGNNAETLPVQGVTVSPVAFPMMDVRTDVNMDIDLQPRIAAQVGGGVVDIGADEVSPSTLALRLSGGGQSAVLGNVQPTAPGGTLYNFTVDMTGPLSTAWVLCMGIAFDGTVTAGATYPNGAVYQNVYNPQFGNLLIDVLNPGYSVLVASGAYDATGNASATVAFNAQPNPLQPALAWMEGEVYLQSFGVPSFLPGSTRLRIELNELGGPCDQ